MELIQGSNDWRLEVEVDYSSGGQVTQSELNSATSLKIIYKYIIPDGEDTTEASWTATGYGEDADGTPYIYYIAEAADIVPDGAQRLVGRAVITDADGLVSKGKKFEIQCFPDEL